ncbi:MAG: immunity 17 family protein [Candidatus Poribacteria bacterium]|nr:immunity 17 family protein [Candidatus Poribacteria bacterium]
MDFVSIFAIAAGPFTIAGAAFNWEWFMNSYKARFFTKILGRSVARIFYGVLGTALFIFGVLSMLKIINLS